MKSRRELFREAKAAAGGIEGLIKQAQNAPYTVYFDDDGNIMAFTKETDFIPRDTWKTYPFEQEQLEILKTGDLTKYLIKQDTTHEGVYYIEAKTALVNHTTVNGFLVELTDDADITYELTVDKLVLSLTKRNVYHDTDPATALYNGKKYIKIYLTAKHDPHSLFHSAVFSVESLVINDKVERHLPSDFTRCSVYAVL
jgi:hypothetical protein